jgi:hypothetical protein
MFRVKRRDGRFHVSDRFKARLLEELYWIGACHHENTAILYKTEYFLGIQNAL